MNLVGLASALVPLAFVACTKSESSPAPSNHAAVTPSVAPAIAPPAPTVAAPVTPPAPPPPAPPDDSELVHWKAGIGDLVVTYAESETGMVVHFAGAATSFDVELSSGLQHELRIVDGNVVFLTLDNVPNKRGELAFVFTAAKIVWDPTAAKPVVAARWKCREENKACPPPAWAGPAIEPAEGPYE